LCACGAQKSVALEIIGGATNAADSPPSHVHELETTNSNLEERARETADRRRAAEEALQSRDTFIQEATHELRAPITNLLGAAQLFLRDLNRDEQPDLGQLRRYGGIIEHQARRLSRLVDHLLELPRLEDNALRLDRRITDLAELVRRVAASLQATGLDQPIDVDMLRHAPVCP
jgi:signal transduction histidine kinase